MLIEEYKKINDAIVYGKVRDEILDRQIEVTFSPKGRTTPRGAWRVWRGTVNDWALNLSQHRIGDKDGDCWCPGVVVGGDRREQAVKHLDFMAFDVDVGEPIDAMISRLQELGWFAIIYTTHSHMKDITSFKRDTLVKFSASGDPSVEDFKRFLVEKRRYIPEMLEGAELLDVDDSEAHTSEGVQMFLRHRPLPKYRVILLLKERFVIAKRGGTQRDAITEYKELYFGVSDKLGAFCDRACQDPSRLFYRPRHPAGATEYGVYVVAGEPLDLDTITRVTAKELKERDKDPFQAAAEAMGGHGGGTYQTPDLLRFVATRGKRFELVDMLSELLDDGDQRGNMAAGSGRIFRCPNDEQHSNAGDSADVGFWAVNASDTEDKGFQCGCRHDSCSGIDRVGMLDLICVESGITDTAKLEKWCFKQEGDEEEAQDEAQDEAFDPRVDFVDIASCKAVILGLDRGQTKEAMDVAHRVGMSNFTDKQRRDLLFKVSNQTGVGYNNLAVAADKAHKEKIKESLTTQTVDDETLKLFNWMNEHYAVISVGSKTKILEHPEEPGVAPVLKEINAMSWELADKHVLSYGPDGKPRKAPLFETWMKWDGGRAYYKGLVFEPAWDTQMSAEKRVFNIWKGLPRLGQKGDWSLLRGHIIDNIVQGDEEYDHWLMTWLADLYQNPGNKRGSAVVIKGQRGTGKSKLFDWQRRALGVHAAKVSQSRHITGHFNGHQEALILLICEEAFWAGDHQAQGAIKDLITDSMMMMEKKGVDPLPVSNHARLAMISNERWVVPAGLEDERRFGVFECSSARRGDISFFAAIDEQMANGGLDAMIYDLRKWTPAGDDWDILRKPPETPWLYDQAIETLDIVDRFFIQLVEESEITPSSSQEEEGWIGIKLSETEKSYIDTKNLRYFFEEYIKSSSAGRRYKGHQTLVYDLAEKYLKASHHFVIYQDARALEVPPLTEIRDHLRGMNISFREIRE